MFKKKLNESEIKNNDQSNKIRSFCQNLDSNIVSVVFNEIKNCEEEKKEIIGRFYNKINLLVTITSIILSGNLLLFSFIFDERKLIFTDWKIYIFILSTVLILVSLVFLLHALSFKSIYKSKDELKILEMAKDVKEEKTILKSSIAQTAFSIISNNKNYEEIKDKLKIVFKLLIVSIVMMFIGSILLLSSPIDKDDNLFLYKDFINNKKITYQELERIRLSVEIIESKLDNIIYKKEVMMSDNEENESETFETTEQIPDPASMLNYHTESANEENETKYSKLNENSDD